MSKIKCQPFLPTNPKKGFGTSKSKLSLLSQLNPNRVALDVSLVVSDDLLLGIMSFPHAAEKREGTMGPQQGRVAQVLFAFAPCVHLGVRPIRKAGGKK